MPGLSRFARGCAGSRSLCHGLPLARSGAGRVGQELDCPFVGQGEKPEKPALFSLPPGPADAARETQFGAGAMVPIRVADRTKRPARKPVTGRVKIGQLTPEDDGFEECVTL